MYPVVTLLCSPHFILQTIVMNVEVEPQTINHVNHPISVNVCKLKHRTLLNFLPCYQTKRVQSSLSGFVIVLIRIIYESAILSSQVNLIKIVSRVHVFYS